MALWIALAIAERQLNAYFVFHYHQYVCSATADLLRYLSLGIALVLCFADVLSLPWRWLRFIIVLLLIALFGQLQIALNAWPMLHAAAWTMVFSLMLLVFMVGHALVLAVLRRWVSPAKFRRVHAVLCLVVGILPGVVLLAIEWGLSRSIQLQSTTELFRTIAALTSAVSLPYFVFFWFVLLATCSPLYAQRLARGFGLPQQTTDQTCGEIKRLETISSAGA